MINCIAVDDEPLALKQLENYISQVPFLDFKGGCRCAAEAMKYIREDIVDAIFLDINMPDINGIDFVKTLVTPPIIVFTTAYADYAVEGFKVNAVDYLLKPFGLDEFRRAAEKVRVQYEQREGNSTAVADEDDSLFFKTDYKIVRVNVSSISCIEGMSEYLKLHMDGNVDPLVILLSMKKLEGRLPSYFMRVHKSYIINLRKIREVARGRVLMEDGTLIPVGDMYKEAFQAYLDSKFLGK
jgi:response regulator receiver domain protein|uniref:LytR/AlgR family response regulator transcription factor n=1 Tax=Candidatus Cryptobacteroides bacterium TaxID=3085639 RepID=UPI004028D187